MATPKKTSTTSPLPGKSAFFDVLDSLKFTLKDDPSLAAGLGADTCNNKSTVAVCGVVVLPNGIGSPAAALSSGVCSRCPVHRGPEVQFIAGLTDASGADLYSRAQHRPPSPALRQDLLQGQGGLELTAKISLLAAGRFTVSPACTTKGVLTYPDASDPRNHFCTDYVASHRDNAGDLLLEVLFDRDMKGTM